MNSAVPISLLLIPCPSRLRTSFSRSVSGSTGSSSGALRLRIRWARSRATAGSRWTSPAYAGPDRGGDLFGLGVLQDVARRAGLEGRGDLLLLDEGGHGHDLGLGPLGLDPADRGDAVHVRHQQVHQDDVRLEAAGHRHALGAVGGLADDLDVGLEVEEDPQPHPDDRMVVDDEHADGGGSVTVTPGAGRYGMAAQWASALESSKASDTSAPVWRPDRPRGRPRPTEVAAVGRSCGRTRRPPPRGPWSSTLVAAHHEDADAGRRGADLRDESTTAVHSGSRGSTTTTSGCRSANEVEGRPVWPADADDHEPVADARAGRRGSRGPDRRDRRRGRAAGAGVPARSACRSWWRTGRRAGTRHPARQRSAERRSRPTSSRRGSASRSAAAGARRRPPSIAAAGTMTSMVVPSPVRCATVNAPPILSARARIPARPRWPSGTRVGSKPLPSSRICRRTPRWPCRARGGPARAPACLTMLWSASCAIR